MSKVNTAEAPIAETVQAETIGAKGPFEIIPSEGYFTVKLSGVMTADTAKLLGARMEELTALPARDCVINLENASELTLPWVRALLQLQVKLKNINKQMRLILVNDVIQSFLKKEGVDKTLLVSNNLRAAMVAFGLVKAKAIDVNFINPFLTATTKVLSVQCQTEAKAQKPYTKLASEKFTGDISGVIGLVSEAFSGSVVISFPGSTFLKVMSRMLGEEYKEINKEIEDGAGELTNIIFGQAKILLNDKGFGIKTAIPSVVSGQDHSVQQLSKGPRVAIPFETDIGPFTIEICVSE